MTKILLADDDGTIVGFVQMILEAEGYELYVARHGNEALEMFYRHHPDLLLLDVMMPHLSGIEVCQRIRLVFPLVPILLLTARQQPQDVVEGLESGADDYITKPFNRDELLARVKAALRRQDAIQGHLSREHTLLQVDSLSLDLSGVSALLGTQHLTLSRTEFRLLRVFAEFPNQVLARTFLLNQVWEDKLGSESRSLDNFVGRLRRKLQDALQSCGLQFPFIESIYGVGYRLVSSETKRTPLFERTPSFDDEVQKRN